MNRRSVNLVEIHSGSIDVGTFVMQPVSTDGWLQAWFRAVH
jgi:hypothetical protein